MPTQKYRVEINSCQCHPETCGCNDWRIVDDKGIKVATFFRKEAADSAAELLNGRETAQETVPAWLWDRLVSTLDPAWEYIQQNPAAFNARPGDDKSKILVDWFLRHVDEPQYEYREAGAINGHILYMRYPK